MNHSSTCRYDISSQGHKDGVVKQSMVVACDPKSYHSLVLWLSFENYGCPE